MNYIVFDLEWNHPQIDIDEKVYELPFEIIEIGAVKLDNEFKFISHFSELIKPQVYSQINEIIHEIVKLDTDDFKRKSTFDKVVKRFFEWCGEEYVFCTWGSMDLTELERNMDFYHINDYLKGPIKYIDVQKLFSLQYIGHKDMQSLENVIDFFNLEKSKNFHRAHADARYTAEILKRIDKHYIQVYYSIDCYHNPKTKDEAVTATFDTYSKYISGEYKSKELAMEDIDINTVECYICKKKATIKTDWFCSSPRVFTAVAECSEHGTLKSKIRIRKKNDGNVFVIKTTKLINNDEVLKINKRQQVIRAKRKAKRIRKKHDLENN